jgi:hypothetical protein
MSDGGSGFVRIVAPLPAIESGEIPLELAAYSLA